MPTRTNPAPTAPERLTRAQVNCMEELLRRGSKPDDAEIRWLIAAVRRMDEALREIGRIAGPDTFGKVQEIVRAARLADAEEGPR